MNTLALQQQALLEALFARPGSGGATSALLQLHAWLKPQSARGLMAYQANGHALAERSLQAAYPVVAQLIGLESLNALARDLWHSHPPLHGDLAQWGDALPAFLVANEQLNDVPYLADVARVEWALHRAAGAPDAQTDLRSFARLSNEDPEGLTLVIAPGSSVITSPWPVASLITSHTEHHPSLDEAGRRVRNRTGETAVVWRQGFRPCLSTCSAETAGVLQALLSAEPLTHALAQAGSGFDFSDWLTPSVQSGLVIGVASARPRHQPTGEAP